MAGSSSEIQDSFDVDSPLKPKFPCPICGKSFILKHVLGLHLKKHSGKEGHECEVCYQEFEDEKGLRDHIFSQHREEKEAEVLECFRCYETFQCEDDLNRHDRRCADEHDQRKSVRLPKIDTGFPIANILCMGMMGGGGFRQRFPKANSKEDTAAEKTAEKFEGCKLDNENDSSDEDDDE